MQTLKWIWEQIWKVWIWLFKERVVHAAVLGGALVGAAHTMPPTKVDVAGATMKPADVKVIVSTPKLKLIHDEKGCHVDVGGK